jgi:hypothetical protein
MRVEGPRPKSGRPVTGDELTGATHGTGEAFPGQMQDLGSDRHREIVYQSQERRHTVEITG